MKTLTLVQGSAEWHAHRATAFNASDVPAMLGISKYKSRAQLLKERATGIVPEVDAATQRRFNDGHRFEALARPLAEQIIGDTLSPVTGVNGKYSASFDGITFDESVIFEHKALNQNLRETIGVTNLDDHYTAQMEHQLYVSGAEKCLFMASSWDESGNLLEEKHCWYYSHDVMRGRIIAGWEQFAKDLAEYSPATEAEKVTGCAVMALPALSVQIRGEVTNSNLPVFVSEADKFLSGIKTVLETDQDFADAESNVKACKDAEDGIEQTKKAITAQATSIDEVMRTMDLYKDKLRDVRLKLTNLVKSEKESRKLAIVSKAGNDFTAHVQALEAETRPIQLNVVRPDFAGAIKGLKSLTSMQEKVDTALRDGKFAADQIAADVRAKLAWCKETSAGFGFLFSDLSQIITKPMDDFKLVVTTRIADHKAAEAVKAEEAIKRIEAEAKAKAEREAAAKLAEEEARIRAEERAKAEAEAKAQRVLDELENKMLAQQEAAANKNTHESKAVTLYGERPALVQMEPAAPATSKVIHIAKAKTRPSDKEIIDVLALHFRVHESKVIEWLLEVDLKAASERMAKEFA